MCLGCNLAGGTAKHQGIAGASPPDPAQTWATGETSSGDAWHPPFGVVLPSARPPWASFVAAADPPSIEHVVVVASFAVAVAAAAGSASAVAFEAVGGVHLEDPAVVVVVASRVAVVALAAVEAVRSGS